MNDTLAIVGCGGSGGWAISMLAKSPKQDLNIVLIDGDRWEAKNLDRCNMGRRDIGKYKAAAALKTLLDAGWASVDAWPVYLAAGTANYQRLIELPGTLRILSCPDNHPARNACLRIADLRHREGRETVVVLTGNEYQTAEAMAYLPEWQGTPLDPRVRYPEIELDTAGDPLRPPCTGEAVESAPQLALANGLSAYSGLWLMNTWAVEMPKRKDVEYGTEIINRLPVAIQWSPTGLKSQSKEELCRVNH